MKADNTDKLIAGAIAGLPYRRPSAAFSARVLAAVTAPAQVEAEFAWLVKTSELITGAWAGIVVLASAGFFFRFLSENAGWLSEPGGLRQALKLTEAYCALLSVKLYAVLLLGADLAGAAAALLPPCYEIAAAALGCALIIKAVSGGRLAAQKI